MLKPSNGYSIAHGKIRSNYFSFNEITMANQMVTKRQLLNGNGNNQQKLFRIVFHCQFHTNDLKNFYWT